MGSLAAMENGSKDRYFQEGAKKLVPEGVEGRVAYKGNVEDTVFQLVGGIRSGMGYCGCPTIEDLKEKSKFVKSPLLLFVRVIRMTSTSQRKLQTTVLTNRHFLYIMSFILHFCIPAPCVPEYY